MQNSATSLLKSLVLLSFVWSMKVASAEESPYCGIPEGLAIESHGLVQWAIAGISADEGTTGAGVGPILLSWSTSNACATEDQHEVTNDGAEPGCFHILRLDSDHYTDGAENFIQQNSDRITIFGKAPTEEVDEGRLPILTTTLHVPGYRRLYIERQRPKCGQEKESGDVDLSVFRDRN